MAKPPNYKAGACRSSRVSNVRYKIKNKQKMRFPTYCERLNLTTLPATLFPEKIDQAV